MADIVIIDDDQQLLKLLKMMLERGGHTATPMDDPQKGLEYLEQHKPDLLILDLMMPRISGHEVCRRIRETEHLADLPIIILTARAQNVDRSAALKSGADDYMSKPVTAQELMEHVNVLLARRATERARKRDAMLISLFSLRGGVGRTTLAVNLAAALRRQSGDEVCLVDLSPSGGQAALHLRLPVSSSWADVTSGPDLTWEGLERHLLTHKSGLRVLAAPPVPHSPSRPAAEHISPIFRLLRKRTLFTIIDLPPILSTAVLAALQASDIVLHVIAPEVISVQTALNGNRALAALQPGIGQKVYVLNQPTADAQLAVSAVERGLNTRLVFHINHDAQQGRALAQGFPLSLVEEAASPLPATVRRIAQAVQQQAAELERVR